jgi:uncharacterized Tic20 family protein
MADEVPQPMPPADAAPVSDGTPTSDERTMGLLCHLGCIVLGFLCPLLIWLMKKDTSKFVDDQGKESLNFQITVTIAYVACFILTFAVIGIFLFPVVMLGNLVLCILGGLAANKGEKYRYPFAIRLIK